MGASIRMPRALAPPGTATGVVSAAPQLIQKEKSRDSIRDQNPAGSGVIEAKPQMRNLLSDVTRFVPTNVKMHKKVDGSKGNIGEFGATGGREGGSGNIRRHREQIR